MRAEILSIGSELILGHLTDTNATYLAQQLAELGIELTLVTQVGDDLPRLAATIERATAGAEIVICTGGVGPTADDLTREAIALVAGEEPVVDPNLLDTLKAFFRSRGFEMPERNKKQAWLISSAEALPNPVGTAPGWFVRRDGHIIAAMPGVPREMFKMWRDQVVPRLMAIQGARSIRTVTIRTIGIGESAAEQTLHDLVASENPIVATYAKDDGVHIRVTAIAAVPTEAVTLRDATASEVSRRLGQYIYGTDDTSLPEALASLLNDRKWRLVISDGGGGGRFASMIASHPAAAQVLAESTMVTRFDGIGARVLAEKSASTRTADVGAGVVVDVAQIGNGVFEGTITVALAGKVNAEESIPVRSGYEDLQRRSALFAADVLRRALISGKHES